MRAIFDRSRPFFIDGIKVKYYLPFAGEAELFKCRPNQYSINPPHALIEGKELVFEFSVVDQNIARTKTSFEREIVSIKQWASWINTQVDAFNADLDTTLGNAIRRRQEMVRNSRNQVSDLGFKVRPRKETVQSVEKENQKPQKKSIPRPNQTQKNQDYDVALSFAGEDRDYVSQVAGLLRQKGVKVFYDDFEKSNLWGKNLIDHLGEVYSTRSRFIVMFISEHYAVKSWPNHERKSAQARAIKMQEDCILPVRFDDTEIPGTPSSVGFIDLRVTSPQELANLIAQKLRQ